MHRHCIITNSLQISLILYVLLLRAFCDGCNTVRLEHFFSLIFEYILGTKSIFASSNKTVDPLDGFLNCIEGARWLDLPSESKVWLDPISRLVNNARMRKFVVLEKDTVRSSVIQ